MSRSFIDVRIYVDVGLSVRLHVGLRQRVLGFSLAADESIIYRRPNLCRRQWVSGIRHWGWTRDYIHSGMQGLSPSAVPAGVDCPHGLGPSAWQPGVVCPQSVSPSALRSWSSTGWLVVDRGCLALVACFATALTAYMASSLQRRLDASVPLGDSWRRFAGPSASRCLSSTGVDGPSPWLSGLGCRLRNCPGLHGVCPPSSSRGFASTWVVILEPRRPGPSGFNSFGSAAVWRGLPALLQSFRLCNLAWIRARPVAFLLALAQDFRLLRFPAETVR